MTKSRLVHGMQIQQDVNGRHKNDFYPTMAGVTVSLLENVTIGGLVCAPCAGKGHMTRVLRTTGSHVVANDIDPTMPGLDYVGDAADPMADVWQNPDPYDWTVENPPFNVALPILKNAWERSSVGIAMLLRLSFLEPTKNAPAAMKKSAWAEELRGRGDWLQAHSPQMSHLIIMGSPRPSFTEKGTDNVTSVWAVWRKGWKWGTSIIYAMDWKVS